MGVTLTGVIDWDSPYWKDGSPPAGVPPGPFLAPLLRPSQHCSDFARARELTGSHTGCESVNSRCPSAVSSDERSIPHFRRAPAILRPCRGRFGVRQLAAAFAGCPLGGELAPVGCATVFLSMN